MQTVTILCVGKLKEKYWRDACAEYAKRLNAYCKFYINEVEETRLPTNPSDAEITACLQSEGKRLLSKIPARAQIYTLCIEGKGLSSAALAKNFESAAVSGFSNIVFIIGGSYGLSDEVKFFSHKKISMSLMTFPHQLARVMLCEQIYRAFSINNDGKYHK